MTTAAAPTIDTAAVEALMAAMAIDRDQAEAAVAKVMADLAAEPIPEIASGEAEIFLCRYLRRRTLIESELTRVKDQMKAMVKGLEAELSSIDYLCKPQAETYTRELLKGKKGKSIKYPHGTVGFRATTPSVEFIDGHGLELLAWCQKNCPAAIKQPPPEILKTPLADILKLGVADVPGAKLKPATEQFYAK